MKIFLTGVESHVKNANIALDRFDDGNYRPYILASFYVMTDGLVKLIPWCDDFLLDSGAFTFLNSSKTGIDWDDYIKRYAEFIVENDIKHYFELDIDPIVGYGKVLEFRTKLEELTGRQCIPVWHKSRGYADFLDMCDKYSYAAIGGFAIKELKPQEYPLVKHCIADAYRRGCNLHGLGFTRFQVLSEYKFWSVDSTTWTTGNRFGYLYRFNGETLKKTIFKPDGKRFADPNALTIANFTEWLKFQKYAKTHFRKGRKHHEKNRYLTASDAAIRPLCLLLSDQQHSCRKAIRASARHFDDYRRRRLSGRLHPL